MKKYNITNNGYATLELPISDSDTTILLAGPFETLPTSNFILKITHREAGEVKIRENVYVTNRVGSTCTGVIRAYEPVPMNETSERAVQQAYAFEAGDIVECTISSEIVKDLQNEVERKLFKNELRTNLSSSGFPIVENGNEAIKNIVKETATQTDAVILKKENGDFKEVNLGAFSDFVSGGEIEELEIVEAPQGDFTRTFSNQTFSSAGIQISGTELYMERVKSLSSSQQLYSTGNYRPEYGPIVSKIFLSQDVLLSRLNLNFSGVAYYHIYLNGVLLKANVPNGDNVIDFEEQKVKEIKLEFTFPNTNSSQQIYSTKFLITGKYIQETSFAYSKIESGLFSNSLIDEDYTRYYGSRVENYGIVVQFPMDTEIEYVRTKRETSSVQARVFVLDEGNSRVGEFIAPNTGTKVLYASSPVRLEKNRKYKIVLNNSENFGGQHGYMELNKPAGLIHQHNMGGFLKAGWINNSEHSSYFYDVTELSLKFKPCLVLSRGDLHRYNFIGMIKNPSIGQMVQVKNIEGKIISGFSKLTKNQWYYLSMQPGFITGHPEGNKPKNPIGYAVSTDFIKATTKGSPQHTFGARRYIGTGDFMFCNSDVKGGGFLLSKIVVDAYSNSYTYVYKSEKGVEYKLSNFVSITL